MMNEFPTAEHLLCELHVRGNILTNSKDVGSENTCYEICRDIFGERKGPQKLAGLVDFTRSREEYDSKVTATREKWREIR
jgi:hypothetical protein